MKKIMKFHYLIALALTLLGLLITNPANALQSTASIDMSLLTITVTDLNSQDGISPVFTLSNLQSYASVWWLKYNPGTNYFTDTIDGGTNSSSDWTSNLTATYATPGANGNAALMNSMGTTEVIGYDDGKRLAAGSGRRADFTLTGHTQVEIWIPVDLMVDPAGSDPTLPSGMGREAYARTTLGLFSSDFSVQAYDTLWRDHWTSGVLTGSLHVIFKNEGDSLLSGFVEAGAFSDTMSYMSSSTVPEPATMLLLGSGLVGLAGYGRKKLFKK